LRPFSADRALQAAAPESGVASFRCGDSAGAVASARALAGAEDRISAGLPGGAFEASANLYSRFAIAAEIDQHA
jgi:hypothetical protein